MDGYNKERKRAETIGYVMMMKTAIFHRPPGQPFAFYILICHPRIYLKVTCIVIGLFRMSNEEEAGQMFLPFKLFAHSKSFDLSCHRVYLYFSFATQLYTLNIIIILKRILTDINQIQCHGYF